MGRLIDADRFIEWLDVGHLRSPSEICYCEGNVKTMIDMQPTVDAVSRAEHEEVIYKLECLLCQTTGNKLSKHTYDLKTMESVAQDYIDDVYYEGREDGEQEVARNIFKEIEKLVDVYYHAKISFDEFEEELAELKKEYTGDES